MRSRSLVDRLALLDAGEHAASRVGLPVFAPAVAGV
jgi:hypothetical protein